MYMQPINSLKHDPVNANIIVRMGWGSAVSYLIVYKNNHLFPPMVTRWLTYVVFKNQKAQSIKHDQFTPWLGSTHSSALQQTHELHFTFKPFFNRYQVQYFNELRLASRKAAV